MKPNWLLKLVPLWHALSDGANHTSVAASVRKLLVFFTVPTQLGQIIGSGLDPTLVTPMRTADRIPETSPAISAVSLKLPQFWPADPEVWIS